MDVVEVNVKNLIEKIKENKKKHDILYKESIEGYWKKSLEVLTSAIDKLENKDRKWYQEVSNIGAAIPEDHSKDYDRAINMLEMSVTKNIQIKRTDFDCFIMNQWHWRDTFLNIHSSYTGVSGLQDEREDMNCMHGKNINF